MPRSIFFPYLSTALSSSGVLVGQGLPHGGPCFLENVLYIAAINLTTMNASEWINSLCDWIEREIDHVDAGGRGRQQPYTREMVRLGRLAAAKEEQGKALTVQEIDALCDAYHNYVKNRYPDQWPELSTGFEAGVRAVADSGYLAPAKGLDDYTTLLVNVLRMSDADQKRLVKDLAERGLVLDAFPNGYFLPPPKCSGVDVEAIVQVVKEWHLDWCDSRPANSTDFDVLAANLRRALEAHAENSSGNLRTDPWISVERLKEVRADVLHNADGYPNEQVNWCLGILDELLPLPAPPDNTTEG